MVTTQISIDSGHIFAGQGALSAVYSPYIIEDATRSCENMALSQRAGSPFKPFGVTLRLFDSTKPHSACLAWLERRASAGHLRGNHRTLS